MTTTEAILSSSKIVVTHLLFFYTFATICCLKSCDKYFVRLFPTKNEFKSCGRHTHEMFYILKQIYWYFSWNVVIFDYIILFVVKSVDILLSKSFSWNVLIFINKCSHFVRKCVYILNAFFVYICYIKKCCYEFFLAFVVKSVNILFNFQ